VAKGMDQRRSVVCISVAVCAVLVAPGSAPAEIDQSSVTTSAEINAQAWDGAGETPPDAKFDDDENFDFFESTLLAKDRNRDSGRSGKSEVTQTTQISTLDETIVEVDSTAFATGSFTDPNLGDGLTPFGNGLSEFDLGFTVVDNPVKYSITGTIAAEATPATPQCTEAEVSTFPGFAGVSSGCGEGPESEDIDLAGELAPGTHEFNLNLRTLLGSGLATSGAGSSGYEIRLRFCTILVQSEITQGTAGEDVICGTQGADTIFGNGGNDLIFGNGGADTIDGGAFGDTIFGDDGDDARLYGGPGDDLIDAGPGDDGREVTGDLVTGDLVVAGGPGDDEIIGGPGDDVLVGRCFEALFGTPSPICPLDPPTGGETDDDSLDGGPGEDDIDADGGTNLIIGGDGNDSAGALGSEANTFLLGPGNDEAAGGNGPDRMEGEAGNDRLAGVDGKDCLIAGSGKDELKGLAGDDKLLAKDGRKDKVNGGPGPDKGRFDGQDRVRSVSNRSFQGGC